MNQLVLELSVEEGNLILEALGQLPFVKVYPLIGKIQSQAQRQLNQASARSVSLREEAQHREAAE